MTGAPPAQVIGVPAKAGNSNLVGGSAEGAALAPGLKIMRAITASDVEQLAGIAREYHNESRYAHIPFSEKKFLRTFIGKVTQPHDTTLSLYVEFDGEIVGLLGAEVGEYFLGVGGRIATNYILYVSPKVRNTMLGGKIAVRLMRIFMEWARAREAQELNIHATSGIDPERTDKWLRRLGFKTYGGNYAMRAG